MIGYHPRELLGKSLATLNVAGADQMAALTRPGPHAPFRDIEVELAGKDTGLTVERKVNKQNSYLELRLADGQKVSRPQEVLDRLEQEFGDSEQLLILTARLKLREANYDEAKEQFKAVRENATGE